MRKVRHVTVSKDHPAVMQVENRKVRRKRKCSSPAQRPAPASWAPSTLARRRRPRSPASAAPRRLRRASNSPETSPRGERQGHCAAPSGGGGGGWRAGLCALTPHPPFVLPLSSPRVQSDGCPSTTRPIAADAPGLSHPVCPLALPAVIAGGQPESLQRRQQRKCAQHTPPRPPCTKPTGAGRPPWLHALHGGPSSQRGAAQFGPAAAALPPHSTLCQSMPAAASL